MSIESHWNDILTEQIMNARYSRLIGIISALLILTSWDVFVNTTDKFKTSMMTYITLFVGFHALALESVVSKSVNLIRIVWFVVVIISLSAYLIFDEWYAAPLILLFLVVYTAALIAYLKKIFSHDKSERSE